MRVLRFIDCNGMARWGRSVEENTALPLIPGLFSPWHFESTPVRVCRRLAPVDPPNIIAIGRNYREHAKEMKAESMDAEPLIFLKATTSVIGPDDPIVLPRSAPDEVDFEAELAVIIGRRVRNVAESDAMKYVLGLTCANDVSARDCQKRRDKQWARGKSFDSFCPLGPVIVSPEDLDTGRLHIRSRLNGRVMQDSSTSEMHYSVPALISYISHQFTLVPGTIVLTGTPAGVGAARTPPVFLRPGDEISVEIEGIGELNSRVFAE